MTKNNFNFLKSKNIFVKKYCLFLCSFYLNSKFFNLSFNNLLNSILLIIKTFFIKFIFFFQVKKLSIKNNIKNKYFIYFKFFEK